jgi:transposase
LGENFSGILNSDRYASYNWVGLEQRQLCWAHLKREFVKISERTGVSKEIGEALLRLEEELFKLWYQVRDGTLKRCEFHPKVQSIRNSLKSCLEETANYQVGYKNGSHVSANSKS